MSYKTFLHYVLHTNHSSILLRCKDIRPFPLRNRSTGWMWQGPKPKKGEYQRQKYDYLLVLDFEATCNKASMLKPQEIIEFPCALINTKKSFDVVSIFHEYVRPVHHPTLTTFCTDLTGITQDVVEKEETFPSVFFKFTKWLEENKLTNTSQDRNFTYITCGDWDLNYMLPSQCSTSQIEIPNHLKHWINVKKSFAMSQNGNYPRSLSVMLKELSLTFEGRQHSGIDDVHNIVKVVQALAKDRNYVFENTS